MIGNCRSRTKRACEERTFVRHFCVFASIQLVLLGCVVAFDDRQTSHYLAAFGDKLSRLKTATGPRVILVGGSNLAFGIDSTVVQNKTNFNPVNLGLYQPLGIEYQLRMIESLGRPGDLIIVACEEGHWLRGFDPTSSESVDDLINEVADAGRFFRNSTAAEDVDAKSWKAYLDKQLLTSIGQSFRRAVDRLESGAKRDASVYHRGAFNQFGDCVAHHNRPPSNAPVSIQRFSEGQQDRVAGDMSRSLKRFIEFSERMATRDIHVAVAFPPTPLHMQDQCQAVHTAIERSIQFASESGNAKVAMLGSFDEETFEDKDFFDTYYHLNRRGKQIRSVRLARQIHSLTSASIARSRVSKSSSLR